MKHDIRWLSRSLHFACSDCKWKFLWTVTKVKKRCIGMCAHVHMWVHLQARKQESEHTQSCIQVNQLTAWWMQISPSGNEAAICLLEFSQRRMITSRLPSLLGWNDIWGKVMFLLAEIFCKSYPFIEACRVLEDHRFQLLIKSLHFFHSKIKPRRILPMFCTIHSYFLLQNVSI